jgi:hypothetical protein
MSKITDYGELMGETIVKIFGNEIIYNDLIAYAQSDGTHVKVYNRKNNETKKIYIQVYFDGNLVLDQYYGQHHSCDMFYYLNELETEMEESGSIYQRQPECDVCGLITDKFPIQIDDHYLCSNCMVKHDISETTFAELIKL